MNILKGTTPEGLLYITRQKLNAANGNASNKLTSLLTRPTDRESSVRVGWGGCAESRLRGTLEHV